MDFVELILVCKMISGRRSSGEWGKEQNSQLAAKRNITLHFFLIQNEGYGNGNVQNL